MSSEYILYKITGTPEDIDGFYNLLKSCDENGRVCFAYVMDELTGDAEETNYYPELSRDSESMLTLKAIIMEDGYEPDDWCNIVKAKYPSLEFYWLYNLEGDDAYYTNDFKGRFFDGNWLITSGPEVFKFFKTLRNACSYVSNLCGKTTRTRTQIDAALYKLHKSDPQKNYWFFRVKKRATH